VDSTKNIKIWPAFAPFWHCNVLQIFDCTFKVWVMWLERHKYIPALTVSRNTPDEKIPRSNLNASCRQQRNNYNPFIAWQAHCDAIRHWHECVCWCSKTRENAVKARTHFVDNVKYAPCYIKRRDWLCVVCERENKQIMRETKQTCVRDSRDVCPRYMHHQQRSMHISHAACETTMSFAHIRIAYYGTRHNFQRANKQTPATQSQRALYYD
jgi:hypothetical protein